MKSERNRLLGRIHAAARPMGEATYRTILRERFGVESAAALSVADLRRLAAMLDGRWIPVRDADPLARTKRAIAAIWTKLGYSPQALDERVRRAFGVERVAWLHDPGQVHTLHSDLVRRERTRQRREAGHAGR
jgi:hypothetical protein